MDLSLKALLFDTVARTAGAVILLIICGERLVRTRLIWQHVVVLVLREASWRPMRICLILLSIKICMLFFIRHLPNRFAEGRSERPALLCVQGSVQPGRLWRKAQGKARGPLLDRRDVPSTTALTRIRRRADKLVAVAMGLNVAQDRPTVTTHLAGCRFDTWSVEGT